MNKISCKIERNEGAPVDIFAPKGSLFCRTENNITFVVMAEHNILDNHATFSGCIIASTDNREKGAYGMGTYASSWRLAAFHRFYGKCILTSE